MRSWVRRRSEAATIGATKKFSSALVCPRYGPTGVRPISALGSGGRQIGGHFDDPGLCDSRRRSARLLIPSSRTPYTRFCLPERRCCEKPLDKEIRTYVLTIAMPKPSNRGRIVEAGLEVMFRKGYVGAGVRDIVAERPALQGSFTNHFRSKEEFAREVLDLYFDHTKRGDRRVARKSQALATPASASGAISTSSPTDLSPRSSVAAASSAISVSRLPRKARFCGHGSSSSSLSGFPLLRPASRKVRRRARSLGHSLRMTSRTSCSPHGRARSCA